MTPQEIEHAILKVLAEETTAVGVSDKLFTPEGLFSLLASTEQERRVMVQSPLFKKAQKRFRELQFKEADEFRQAVVSTGNTELGKNYRLIVERTTTD
ncbi:MAG: hypothetical protein HY289_05410 [Planctomycetes bacterium]|nr:hypothetical protein [Planctomycetota bacterium]